MSRSISGNQGELEGTITTKDGGAIPVKITLVKESGEWKIHFIERASTGLAEDIEQKEMPSNDRLIEMTNTAIYDLALAINARDFTAFHEKISKLWQSQITTDELFNAFKGFSDNNIDLTVLKDIEPVFSQPPSIDDNDILVLDGYYPSEPPIAYFNLKYIYEYPDWKLFGIHVNMK